MLVTLFFLQLNMIYQQFFDAHIHCNTTIFGGTTHWTGTTSGTTGTTSGTTGPATERTGTTTGMTGPTTERTGTSGTSGPATERTGTSGTSGPATRMTGATCGGGCGISADICQHGKNYQGPLFGLHYSLRLSQLPFQHFKQTTKKHNSNTNKDTANSLHTHAERWHLADEIFSDFPIITALYDNITSA